MSDREVDIGPFLPILYESRIAENCKVAGHRRLYRLDDFLYLAYRQLFFRQRRHGFNNEEIVVWKFRTMRHDPAGSASVVQVRAHDSRISAGPLASRAERTISLATGLVGGVPTAAVPAGSTAATVRVTITGTTLSGFLAVFKAGIAWPGNSNLNWFASGQTFAVTTVSAVNASSQLTVRAGGGGSTQLIIDVIGYYT